MSSPLDDRQDEFGAFRLEERLGQVLSYTPKGGSASDVTAIVSQKEPLYEDEDGGHWMIRRLDVDVQITDVATVLVGDSVVHEGRTYKCHGNAKKRGNVWQIEFEHRQLVQDGGKNVYT